MKKVLIFSIFICALLVVFPCSPGKAYQMDLSNLTNSQLEDIGSLAMGYMITNGDAEELDFSNGDQDVGFLKALGLTIVTEDPTYIIGYGLNWADQKAKALLQTLKDWVENNLTWLYDGWYGTEHKVEYHSPGVSRFSKNFKDLLKDRVTAPDPVTPNPDVNYAVYLNLLNGTNFFTSGIMADFWFNNYQKNVDTNYGNMDIDGPPSMFSFIRTDWNYFVNQYDDYSHRGGLLCYYDSRAYHPTYQINNCYACEPITLYINSIDNITFTLTCSNCDPKKVFYTKNNLQPYFIGNIQYFSDQSAYDIHAGTLIDTYPNVTSFLFTGTLEECFKIACMNFLNVDVYVNGNLWTTGNFDPDDSIIYPIGIPDSFEVLGGGVQGQYNYPTNTYWDLDGLRALIKQAIEDADVVTYSDIAPLIVDVNGQQAVATVNIHRTDYDLIVDEQYIIHPNGNNVFVVPDLSDYTDVTSMIATEGGTSLIPSDIKVVLGAFGIILLVGYLINRMLE